MRNILFILLFVSSISFAQVSQRCPVCPPSLNGVPNGYVLTDSSGHARWQAGGGSGDGWLLTGNSGTDPSTNFIGTTDAVDLVFKTGSAFGLRFSGFLDNEFANTSFGVLSSHNESASCLNNACFGYYAGNAVDTVSSNNTLIGATADVLNPNTDNAIALGFTARASSYQFAISDSVTNLKFNLNGQTNGYVLTTNGTTANWQSFVGTPIKDSIAATGATVSPAINTTHVITSAGAITSATLSFPAGTTGNWILVIFNKAVATLTNSGTGATTVGLVAPLLGTSKTYVNIGGNWY